MITVKTLGLITLIFDILSTCQHVLVGQKVESSIRLKKKCSEVMSGKKEHMGTQIIGQVPGPVVAYPATEGINLTLPFLLLRSGGFALFSLLSPSQ